MHIKCSILQSGAAVFEMFFITYNLSEVFSSTEMADKYCLDYCIWSNLFPELLKTQLLWYKELLLEYCRFWPCDIVDSDLVILEINIHIYRRRWLVPFTGHIQLNSQVSPRASTPWPSGLKIKFKSLLLDRKRNVFSFLKLTSEMMKKYVQTNKDYCT